MSLVTVSGPDNVGKTTQIRMFTMRSDAVDAGPLDAFDARWSAAHADGLAAWWFERASVAEVADTLACSYLARLEAARHRSAAGELVLVDRGPAMLEASVVATVAVREELPSAAAAERAAGLLAAYSGDLARAGAGVPKLFLLHATDPGHGAARALARETAADARYVRYQRFLTERVHQLADGTDAIVTAEAPVIDVHARVCAWLRAHHLAALDPPALHGVHVLALGGLSECGKSTAGDHLQRCHGYARLKIGYLLESAAAAQGISDLYDRDERTLAELLVLGLDAFCAAHHYTKTISIESLHRHVMTAELRKLLGSRLTVVFIDAAEHLRQARSLPGPADVIARDQVKCSRGADRIRELADEVIANNGPRLGLFHALDALISARRWRHRPPRQELISVLRLPDAITGYLTAMVDELAARPRPLVSLVAVTGSSARGKYVDGWSDLDILLIAEHDALGPISDVLHGLAAPIDGLKVGLTLISRAEATSGVLTPRLLHTLRSIAAGTLPVLWAAADLVLPYVDAASDAAASRRDGVAAAVEIRRQLLRATVEARTLYKVTALLAKVALREDGLDRPGDAAALAVLADTYPWAFTALLPGTIEAARTDAAAAIVLAEAVLAWWHSSFDETHEAVPP
jgi:hypothetical protein